MRGTTDYRATTQYGLGSSTLKEILFPASFTTNITPECQKWGYKRKIGGTALGPEADFLTANCQQQISRLVISIKKPWASFSQPCAM